MGYKAYDMDNEPGLFSMIDKKTGKPVVDHDNEDMEKVMGMDWICDINKLQSIIKSETSPITYYCGSASNFEELLGLFDKIILLKVGETTMRERLSSRTNNDFGRMPHIQDWIMTWKNDWEKSIEDKGASIIDANQDLDQVTKEVIELSKK